MSKISSIVELVSHKNVFFDYNVKESLLDSPFTMIIIFHYYDEITHGSYEQIVERIKNFSYFNFNDWRLPKIDEMKFISEKIIQNKDCVQIYDFDQEVAWVDKTSCEKPTYRRKKVYKWIFNSKHSNGGLLMSRDKSNDSIWTNLIIVR